MIHQLRKKQPEFKFTTRYTSEKKVFSLISIIFGAIFFIQSPVASTEVASQKNSPLLTVEEIVKMDAHNPTPETEHFVRDAYNPTPELDINADTTQLVATPEVRETFSY